MSKVYNKTRKEYTQISNKLLLDRTLTFGARGLLALMLSRPEEWDFNMNEIASNTSESYTKVKNYMKELEKSKYVVRLKRGVPGRKSEFEWLYFLNEIPFTIEEIESLKTEYLNKKNTNSNDQSILRPSLSTKIVTNDHRKIEGYINTNTCKNTDTYKNTNKTCTCKEEHASFENILEKNEKGFPCKDKWEKFLVDNLKGVHYQPKIEKAIKKLEKKETEKTIQNYLINTYNIGIEQELSLNVIATVISTGKILDKKIPKTIVTTNQEEVKRPIARAEKIKFMKEELGKEEITRLEKEIFDEIQLDGLALENEIGNLLCKKYNEKYLNKTL